MTELKERLLEPSLVAEFIKGIHEELEEQRSLWRTGEPQRARKLGDFERKISGLMRAIEDGLYDPSMKERLKTLQAEKANLTEADENAGADDLNMLSRPNMGQLYSRKVEDLETVMTGPEVMS